MADDQRQEQPADEEAPRRYPSTIGGLFYLGVLAAALLGLLLIGLSVDWRIGIRIIASSLAVAAGLRLVLRERDAGMLAVRNRWLDVAMLLVVAIGLFVLSVTIPDQPM